MRYLDRAGKPISQLRWTELFHDPAYYVVKCGQPKVDHRRGVKVVASWVGVVADTERTAKTFLVQRWKLVRPGNTGDMPDWKAEPAADRWCATEEEAITAYIEMGGA